MLFGYFSNRMISSHINTCAALVAEQRFKHGLELPIQQGKSALPGLPPNLACSSSGYHSSSTAPFSKPGRPLIFQLFTFLLKVSCPHRLVQHGSLSTGSGILLQRSIRRPLQPLQWTLLRSAEQYLTHLCIGSRVCLSSVPMGSKK